MALIPDFFSNNSSHKTEWKKFIIFLILCLVLVLGIIYLFIPGFFSGPVVERIPIIIEEQTEEVMGILNLSI
ncbi:MAG: hypothetical protein ACLFPF_09620 [Halanaerobiales bacterium]